MFSKGSSQRKQHLSWSWWDGQDDTPMGEETGRHLTPREQHKQTSTQKPQEMVNLIIWLELKAKRR